MTSCGYWHGKLKTFDTLSWQWDRTQLFQAFKCSTVRFICINGANQGQIFESHFFRTHFDFCSFRLCFNEHYLNVVHVFLKAWLHTFNLCFSFILLLILFYCNEGLLMKFIMKNVQAGVLDLLWVYWGSAGMKGDCLWHDASSLTRCTSLLIQL